MARNNHKHEVVARSIEAAKMTPPELVKAYPFTTPQGYTRATDTGRLYARIGKRIGELPIETQKLLGSIAHTVTLQRLRRIANKKKTTQECTSLVFLWVVQQKNGKQK